VLDQQIHVFKGNVLTVIRIEGIKQDSELFSEQKTLHGGGRSERWRKPLA
jgi:hypothetical protein